MREILFRGKRADNKTDWIKGNLIPVIQKGNTVPFIAENYKGGSLQGLGVIPETIGQFTGVYDKNGKPVYEGDIVRYRWTDERYKKNQRFYIAEVEWNKFNAGWGLKHCISVIFRSERLEVVGNIHDNPDYPELRKRF